MEVSSVHTPGGRLKLKLGVMEVTKGNVERLWNSTGPPRASTIAVASMERRILVAVDAYVGSWLRRAVGVAPIVDAGDPCSFFVLLLQRGMLRFWEGKGVGRQSDLWSYLSGNAANHLKIFWQLIGVDSSSLAAQTYNRVVEIPTHIHSSTITPDNYIPNFATPSNPSMHRSPCYYLACTNKDES